VFSMSMAGYLLGQMFPEAIKRLEIIIVIVVFISILPGIIAFLRNRWMGKPETFGEALAAPDEA
jgi:hypothetical protein